MRKIPACRQIIRLAALECSDKRISEITGATRKTVKKVREAAVTKELLWPLDESMGDEFIYYTLFPPKSYDLKKRRPDLEKAYYILQEEPLKIKAYHEYCQECADNGETPVQYSWFCKLMKKEEEQHRATTNRKCRPGELLVVSWMEHSIKLLDSKEEKAYIFIGFLPYSQYVFIRAYKDRGIKTWLEANTKMLMDIEGVPEEIIVMGTKNGVSKGIVDNKFMEWIEYYGVIQVKNSDGKFELDTQEMIAWFEDRLGDTEYKSLNDLNETLELLRYELTNETIVGKKTRKQIFETEEKPYLRKLPEDAFVTKIKKTAQIQRNCHVVYEKRYYSVPYQFLLQGKTSVELVATNKKISIYYNDNLIAEHPNMKNYFPGTYSTRLEHMPSDDEELLLEWNKESMLKRADRAGENARRVIETLMKTKSIRQQTYRVCDMILRFGTVYTYAKLEEACSKIKCVNNGSVYKIIEEELKTMNK